MLKFIVVKIEIKLNRKNLTKIKIYFIGAVI